MHSSQRFFASCVIAVAAAIPLLSHAEEPARLILGKWRHVSLVRTIDGQAAEPQKTNAKSSVMFAANGTWTLTSPANVSSGTYKWIDKQRLHHTIVASGLAMQVGMVSIKEIRVSAQRLEVITRQTRAEMDKIYPPVKEGMRRPNEVVITSVFERDS